jgi:uncharacterized membrane protein YqaE (UPF0057 family)
MALKRKQPPLPEPAGLRNEKFTLFLALLIPPIAISLVTGVIAKFVIMVILAFTGYVVLESEPTNIAIPTATKSNESAAMSEKEAHIEKCEDLPSHLTMQPKLTPFPALIRSRPKRRDIVRHSLDSGSSSGSRRKIEK